MSIKADSDLYNFFFDTIQDTFIKRIRWEIEVCHLWTDEKKTNFSSLLTYRYE